MSVIDGLFETRVSHATLEDGALALGRLASWWLSEDACERLEREPESRRLLHPRELMPGEFVALFERLAPSGAIAPAFALPLEWSDTAMRKGSKEGSKSGSGSAVGDDPRLPSGLRELADRARRRLCAARPRDAHRAERMSLGLGRGCPDLAAMRLTCASAEAAVEAALRCRVADHPPCPRHAVSAIIGPYGLESVEGIAAKRDAAARLGIDTLLVAPTQQVGDPSRSSHPVRIEHVEPGDLERQLGNVVAQFDAPPFGASLADRFAWYGRQRGLYPERRIPFFARELAPEIAASILRRSTPRPIDTLIVVDTLQYREMALLAALVRRPLAQVIVVSDEGTDASGPEAMITLLRDGLAGVDVFAIRCARGPGGHDALEREVGRSIAPTARVGIDLTAGPKDLAFRIHRWHRQRDGGPAGQATYLKIDGGAPRGVESYELLDVGDS